MLVRALATGLVAATVLLPQPVAAQAVGSTAVARVQDFLNRDMAGIRIEDFDRLTAFGTTFIAGDLFESATNKFSALACDPSAIPNPEQLKTRQFQFLNGLFTASRAVEVGLGRFLSGDASQNEQLLVVDYKRSDECPTAIDGTSLVYGYSVRVVVRLVTSVASVNTSFAVIAAQGTMSGRQQTIMVETNGVFNPALNSKIAAITGKNLDVDTYADFRQFLQDMVSLADDSATQFEVRRLGVVSAPRYERSLVSTFALDRLARGRSCIVARDRELPAGLAVHRDVVEEVYRDVTKGPCSEDAPDEIAKLTAQRTLRGIQLRN